MAIRRGRAPGEPPHKRPLERRGQPVDLIEQQGATGRLCQQGRDHFGVDSGRVQRHQRPLGTRRAAMRPVSRSKSCRCPRPAQCSCAASVGAITRDQVRAPATIPPLSPSHSSGASPPGSGGAVARFGLAQRKAALDRGGQPVLFHGLMMKSARARRIALYRNWMPLCPVTTITTAWRSAAISRSSSANPSSPLVCPRANSGRAG